MQPRTSWWVAGLSLASLLLSIVALAAATMTWIDGQVHRMESEDKPEAISASELEAEARVRFPSGSVVLTAIRQSIGRGLEHRIWGKVRIPRGALDRFVTDSKLPPLRPGERVLTDKSLPDSTTWHPDAAREVSGVVDSSTEAQESRNVLVDLDHPVDVTVYLYVVDP